MPKSLYIHIPFCPKVCPYCDFHKMRRNEKLVKAFLSRAEEEAFELYENYPNQLKTIYFGGGTPSHLNDAELERLIAVLERTWGFRASEITIEADPLSFDKERLRLFKDLGFNRLSIGLQSLQDESLKYLGRLHSAKEGRQALDWALEAGFKVSADLITGLIGQNTEQDVLALAKSGVGHISAYSLTIEKNTAFWFRKIKINEDKATDDMILTTDILEKNGFEHYELSNYAKPGQQPEHNKNYWRGGYYLALGPSAVSFLPAKNYLGNRRTNADIKAWLKGEGQKDYYLNEEEYLFDLLFTALRTSEGLDLDFLFKKTSIDIAERYADVVAELFDLGWLEPIQTHLRTTKAGRLYINSIVKKFLENRQ